MKLTITLTAKQTRYIIEQIAEQWAAAECNARVPIGAHNFPTNWQSRRGGQKGALRYWDKQRAELRKLLNALGVAGFPQADPAAYVSTIETGHWAGRPRVTWEKIRTERSRLVQTILTDFDEATASGADRSATIARGMTIANV